MHFLSGNVPIMSIARKFGMDIVTAASESRAYLELPEASLAGCVTWDRHTRCSKAVDGGKGSCR